MDCYNLPDPPNMDLKEPEDLNQLRSDRLERTRTAMVVSNYFFLKFIFLVL